LPQFSFGFLRNNIPCEKLTKSFGMRYFTSYADPGLKMREHLRTAHPTYLSFGWSPLQVLTRPIIA
jgi:hypothetical protein